MTINQALDQLSQVEKPNASQKKLKDSLQNVKIEFGGRTRIENVKAVKNIIKFGDKEGEQK
jgi:hypothetical protein